MEASSGTWEKWTFAQKGLVILAALQLLWATAGLIAEPSFQIGADAPTEKVLWVDFNGIPRSRDSSSSSPPSTSPAAPIGRSTTRPI